MDSWATGFCLAQPALTVVGIWGVTQQVDYVFLSLNLKKKMKINK